MADKPRPTLADYTAIAVSPLLIMALLGSLVYFLVAILYNGEFTERLRYVLACYVFGIVLVARMSMEFGISDRAPLYGSVLALATLVGLGQFVEFPAALSGISWFINAGLIGIVWWSSYKLVYDCTDIDEKAETTGTGVLQAAGLEKTATDAPPEEKEPPRKKKDAKLSWWERYKQLREQRKKTKPPGVWVVYFSLAALPIFGLGQSLIPPADEGRRRHVFWLMAIYVASGLGLLVTTAFLGLRRYLRQRNLQMPRKMTVAWLTAGAGLILVLLVIGALLPRPEAEYSLFSLTPLESKKRDASDYAMKDGEAGKGEGRPGEQKLDKDGKPVNTGDPNKQGNGGQGDAQGKGDGDKGQQQGGNKNGDNTKGNGDQKGEKGQGDEKGDGEKGGQKEGGDAPAKKSGSTKGTNRLSGSLSFLGSVGPILKWIVFGVIAVVVIIFVLRGGLRYLANFFPWLRRLLESLRAFWEGLFGRRAAATVSAEGEVVERREKQRPFRWYRNPFHNGRADEMSPTELVRYSFDALEAWAFEHDLPRMMDDTPIEFAARVGNDVPALEEEAKRLAALYARVLYAKGGLPSNWREVVEQFWEKMEMVAEQPLSA